MQVGESNWNNYSYHIKYVMRTNRGEVQLLRAWLDISDGGGDTLNTLISLPPRQASARLRCVSECLTALSFSMNLQSAWREVKEIPQKVTKAVVRLPDWCLLVQRGTEEGNPFSAPVNHFYRPFIPGCLMKHKEYKEMAAFFLEKLLTWQGCTAAQ